MTGRVTIQDSVWRASRWLWALRRAVGASLLCLVTLVATPSRLLGQRQLFHAYGASEGLDNLNVRCLFQDQLGYLWVGTDNGLFRYDGGTFRAFGHADGLSDTEVVSMAQSLDGRLWIGTNSGLAVMDGMRFESVNVGSVGPVSAVGFDTSGAMYLEREDEILRGVPASNGTYEFRTLARGPVHGLSVKGDDVFFSKDGDLWRLKGEGVERFGSGLGLPRDDWGPTVVDTLGNRWVRSTTRLYELPHSQSHFVDRSAGIPKTNNTHLYTDRHGTVFVSSVSGIVGLAGAHQTLIDVRHGLPADPSGPMLIDREDLLWMGTDGAGLVRRLGHGEWAGWTRDDGLQRNSVWAIMTDGDGKVWVGTNGGLTVLDAHGQLIPQRAGHGDQLGERVLALVPGPNGSFYAGTDTGAVAQYNRHAVLQRTYRGKAGLHAGRISSMAFDHEGRLWAVGTGGCYRSQPLIEKVAARFRSMTVPGVPSETAFRNVMVDDDDSIWIASSRGLLHWKDNQWRVLTMKDGLKSDNLGVVSRDAKEKDKLWIAYRDALGMTRLAKSGVVLSHLTIRDGLHSDAVYGIVPDHRGRLWVSTDMGLDVIDQGRWKHFGSENGLIWNDTDSLALYVDRSENVWIGTSGGLSRYAQPDFPPTDWSPPIVLTSISGVDHAWRPSDEPKLPYSQRSVTIKFAALTYQSGNDVRFRYRLTDFDQRWTETKERSVQFAALPPGDYHFEVTYSTEDGTWNNTPARFSFSIDQPWWRSYWFMAAAFSCFLLIIFLLVHMRLKLLESQKRELEHQVADRTAELVTSHRQLEEIAYYDMLTATPNRRMFVEEFRKRSARLTESESFALLLIDLDHFKHINDTFGHDAGDVVLVNTAARLKAELRETDFVARLGGDEFAILLFTVHDRKGIDSVCERIIESVSAPIAHRNMTLQVGCSVGIAQFPLHADSQEGLYKSADVALYQAKQTSRNGFCWNASTLLEANAEATLV